MTIKQDHFVKSVTIKHTGEYQHLLRDHECCSGMTKSCLYSIDSKGNQIFSVLCFIDKLQKSTNVSNMKLLEHVITEYIENDIEFVTINAID